MCPLLRAYIFINVLKMFQGFVVYRDHNIGGGGICETALVVANSNVMVCVKVSARDDKLKGNTKCVAFSGTSGVCL